MVPLKGKVKQVNRECIDCGLVTATDSPWCEECSRPIFVDAKTFAARTQNQMGETM